MREIFEGVSFAAFAAGNRRIIKAVKARSATTGPVPTEAAEHPFVTWVKRVGGTVGVLVLLWPMIGKWVPTVAGGGIALWVIAALIAGQEHPTAESAADDGDQIEDDVEEDADQVEEEPLQTGPTSAQIHVLTATLAAGGSSVLLTRLASDLGASHPLWKGSTKAVRGLLSEAGIPVREGVRTADGNGPGVHHQDVPDLHSPSVPVSRARVVANVGAGQSANTNANNANNNAEWTTREGFALQACPDNPARTIVLSRPNPAPKP